MLDYENSWRWIKFIIDYETYMGLWMKMGKMLLFQWVDFVVWLTAGMSVLVML